MKIDPASLTKRYYSIGELADMFDVNTSLLRYWETVFTELKPDKSRGGKRKYVKEEVLLINDIYTLVKGKGYTLEGARDALKTLHNLKQIKTELLAVKSQMMKLKSQLHDNQ